MASLIGSLGIFDYKNQEWEIFLGRLKMFIKINKAVFERSENAVLLTHLSDDTYRLVCNLLHPKKVDDASYDDLVKVLSQHFTPKRSTFADRAKFYEATKFDGESAEEWAARLRGLAVYCNFGNELETLLRDRFVLGFKSGPERDRLCEQDIATLTLAKAMEVAQQAACARQARAVAEGQRIKEEPVFRMDGRRGAGSGSGRGSARGGGARAGDSCCAVCGLKSHDATKCRFRNYRCQNCGAKGHLKKVCSVNKVHNIDTQPECEHNSEECSVNNMSNVIDVGALGPYALEPSAYNERARAYTARVATVPAPPAALPPRLLTDVPLAEGKGLLSKPPLSSADKDLISNAVRKAAAAISELRVEHHEDLVVPFRVP